MARAVACARKRGSRAPARTSPPVRVSPRWRRRLGGRGGGQAGQSSTNRCRSRGGASASACRAARERRRCGAKAAYDRGMGAIDEPLLEAGRRALRRHGWQGLTAERIAEEAGISRVTLHRRGVRKEDILAALTERATDAYRAALWPALTAPGAGRERLEQALRALCDSAEDNLELLVALRSQTDAIFHEP